MLQTSGFYRLFLFGFVVLQTQTVFGQSSDVWHKGSGGLWLGWINRQTIAKNWFLQTDVQLRFRNRSSIYDYTLLRTGLYRQWKNGLQVGAGLLYGRNDVNNKKKPTWENEYRIFQDLRWNIPSRSSWKTSLLFRLEQRWFDYSNFNGNDEHVFALRYRARVELRKEFGAHWRLLAGNEWMYQQISGKTRFNQTRVALGTAYQLKTVELQLLLMQMIVDSQDQTVIRLNLIF